MKGGHFQCARVHCDTTESSHQASMLVNKSSKLAAEDLSDGKSTDGD
jgi:hypothetical protein